MHKSVQCAVCDVQFAECVMCGVYCADCPMHSVCSVVRSIRTMKGMQCAVCSVRSGTLHIAQSAQLVTTLQSTATTLPPSTNPCHARSLIVIPLAHRGCRTHCAYA